MDFAADPPKRTEVREEDGRQKTEQAFGLLRAPSEFYRINYINLAPLILIPGPMVEATTTLFRY